eukprot:55432_1
MEDTPTFVLSDSSDAEDIEMQFKTMITDAARAELLVQEALQTLTSAPSSERELQEESEKVKDLLKDLERRIVILEEFFEDSDLESTDSGAKGKVKKHRKIFLNLRASYRSTALNARLNVAKFKGARRKELLGGAEDRARQRKSQEKYDKNAVRNKSKTITGQLTRIKQLLEPEVQRGRAAHETLENASETLTKTHTTYDDYKSNMGRGKSLLDRLKRRELTDHILNWIGFIFFLICVIYVVQKRIPISFWPFSSPAPEQAISGPQILDNTSADDNIMSKTEL